MAAEELIASSEDLLYEEDLLRNAYSLKYWVRYLAAKRAAPARQRTPQFCPSFFQVTHLGAVFRRPVIRDFFQIRIGYRDIESIPEILQRIKIKLLY